MPSNLHGQPPSLWLARQARSIQTQLNSWKNRIAAPSEPLPSAECLSAFIAGASSPDEEATVIAACVHDPGILVQVLIAWQSEFAAEDSQDQDNPEEMDADLTHRLLQLRPAGHSAASVSSKTAPPTAQPTAKSMGSLRWIRLASAGALAAGLVWAVGWWVIAHSAHEVSDAGQTVAGEPSATEEVPKSIDSRGDGLSDAADIRSIAQASGGDASSELSRQPPRLASQTPLEETNGGASERLEARSLIDSFNDSLLVQEQKVSDAEQLTAPDFGPRPKLSELVERQPMELGKEDPMFPPINVSWTKIVGLVAEQTMAGYDRWRPFTDNRRVTSAVADGADAAGNSLAPPPASWLMLPGCYARGNLSTGGELILAEESMVKIYGEGNQLQLHLLQGAAAMRELPPGTRMSLAQAERNGPVVTVEEAATLYFWIDSNQLYASLLSGRVAWEKQEIERQQKLKITEERIAVTDDQVATPPWLDRLPTNLVLSRSVLANLARSDDLHAGIDQTLQTILQGGGWQTNPRTTRDLELLARWRGNLALHAPLEPAIHPMWPVRSVHLMRLFSPRDGTNFDLARRQFANQLNTRQVSNYATWQAMLQQQNAPTRADVAQWLGFLNGPDPLFASVADLMLRTLVVSGPAFDPQASVQQRSLVRAQWARIIADANRTQGR